MKKKAIVLFLVVTMAISGVFASVQGVLEKNDWSIGLNLGTINGLGFRYGFGGFDLTSNISANVIFDIANSINIGGDVGAMWQVYDIEIDRKNHLPVTIGTSIGAGATIPYNGEKVSATLSALFMAGIEYPIPDVPLTVYLRAGLGAGFLKDNKFSPYFTGAGYIGLLYEVDK